LPRTFSIETSGSGCRGTRLPHYTGRRDFQVGLGHIIEFTERCPEELKSDGMEASQLTHFGGWAFLGVLGFRGIPATGFGDKPPCSLSEIEAIPNVQPVFQFVFEFPVLCPGADFQDVSSPGRIRYLHLENLRTRITRREVI